MEDKLIEIIALWAPAVLIVLSAINSCTKHHTKFHGILRVILLVVERLSFMASRQTGMTTKPIFSDVGPDPVIEREANVKEQLKRMAKGKKARRRRVV